MMKILLFLFAGTCLLAASPAPPNQPVLTTDPLKEAAYQILEKKCNVCHRKKNPFLVFKPRNMERRAEKIYRAVFVQQRMPKQTGTPLTEEEYRTLKTWLEQQNILP